tara:strand:- start:1771 stop:2172 length:402 start_codon:yes stop_codon:yes gene_type:complete
MKITDVMHETWEEIFDYNELEGERTIENFMDYYELDGKFMMGRLFEDYDGDIRTDFHCGPSVGDGCISDSIYTDGYLNRIICKELNINCDVGAWENGHCLMNMKSLEEGQLAYDRIRERISQDFEVIDEGDVL